MAHTADFELVDRSVRLIKSLILDELISREDLAALLPERSDTSHPETIRHEMEQWYRTLGLEVVTGRRLTLRRPPFTVEELHRISEDGELLVCVPAGVTRREMAAVLRLDSWAADDDLIPESLEAEDFWFAASGSEVPERLNVSGRQLRRELDESGKLGLSLTRYMAFAGRRLYMTGAYPDQGHLTWLTRSSYDTRGTLVAGFDRKGRFRVHGWLPTFQGAKCGARPIWVPDHL